MERVGRFFVGIGFLWVFLVLVVGLLGGLDKPSRVVTFLNDVSGTTVSSDVYRVLAFIVVPLGILIFLYDIWRDPVALWVKAAAPGAFVTLYLLFLLATQPDLGRPFFLWAERAVSAVIPLRGFSDSVEATGGWLIRFVMALSLLAGIPAVIGVVLSLVLGVGSGARRR